MYVVDANVLLYAVNESAERHELSRTWLDAALNGEEQVGFAWTALLAFLRLATHPAVFPRPLEVTQATEIVRDWLAQPLSIVLHPTARHADLLSGLLAEAGSGGNLVNDAHLAALAVEHDAVLVSFDTDYARFRGLRRQVPTG
ncbi:MAG TPA: type II toxin-antitoxin system VapC family toxin [Candidatus Limnocylindria bacterium]|nr:type II toxin-antitoxin system VapC family toxin [Candidatus Limnocylindria bacterium]